MLLSRDIRALFLSISLFVTATSCQLSAQQPGLTLPGITLSPATITLTTSPNPATYGQPVTLTAVVTGPASGVLTFYDGTTILGTSSISGGAATLSTSLLPAGTRKLTASYTTNGLYASALSNTVSQAVHTVPEAALGTATKLSVGTSPTSVAVGDFNSDGVPDLAVANQSSNDVSILIGTGNGTFQPAVNYATSNGPKSIAVGDLNGDGRSDLAVATNNGVSALLGNGDGTFQPSHTYAAGIGPSSAVAIGDFNGFGRPVLAVGGMGTSVLLLALSDGSLGGTADLNVFAAGFVAIGDFNGDGKADLAVTPAIGGSVAILLGKGDLTFQQTVYYPTVGNSSTWVAIDDFNGDGFSDLAIANQTATPNVSILLGNGDGTFQAAVAYPAGDQPYALASGDFNGDGRPDLVVTNFRGSATTLDILLGNGDGTFQVPINYPVSDSQVAVAVADFNGDGRTDVALTNYTSRNVSIFLGQTPTVPISVTTNPTGLPVTVDGTAYTSPHSFDWVAGSSHTLAVTSPQGSATRRVFSTWSDAGAQSHTIETPGTATTYTASFTTYYLLTTEISPAGSGTLSANPVSADRYYLAGTAVQLTATPAIGYQFLAFGGDVASTANPQGVLMSAPHSLSASFASLKVPMLAVSLSHAGNFTQGQNGATYTVTVSNAASAGPATGLVSVTETLPSGLTLVSIAGTGWTCTSGATTCARTDALAPGTSYPAITITVNVASNASPQVTNQVGVWGGGSLASGAADPTTILAPFVDVFYNSPYRDAINLMREYAITAGCQNWATYCPDDNVTRAQMAIFIVRAMLGGDNFTYSATPYFTDVSPQTFGFQWIQKMKELGITAGCGASLYCPDDPVTRAQMAVFIIRSRLGTVADSTFTYPASPLFTDEPADDIYFKWVQRMKVDSISGGCGDGKTYCPSAPVSRAQMAVFIIRGDFNLQLPPATPFLSNATPSIVPVGQTTTVNVTGVCTSFAQGVTQVSAGPGISVGGVTVTSATTLRVDLTVDANAPVGPHTLLVKTGAEEAILPNGLTVQ